MAMRTSAAEVNQSQSGSGVGGVASSQCFSNPSYHTVAQCNVVSTISSNLDGTLAHKVWPPSPGQRRVSPISAPNVCAILLFLQQSGTLKSRNSSEWRAYCNLSDIGQNTPHPPTHHHTLNLRTSTSRFFKGAQDQCGQKKGKNNTR